MSDEKHGEILPPVPRLQYKLPRKGKLNLEPDCLDKIAALASIGCTMKEAAGVMGVSHDYFIKWMGEHPEIRELWWERKQEGRVSLRKVLWSMAKSNPQVAMFLAKQKRYLGMSEERGQTLIDNRTIVVTDEENRARILELIEKAKGSKK